MTEEFQEQMRNFLLGNWNLSMDSVEGVIEEILSDYTEGGLLEEIEMIKTFLASNEDEEWKTRFIEENTEIYWPNMEKSPIDWLEYVKGELERGLLNERD